MNRALTVITVIIIDNGYRTVNIYC